ncbi:hypothetical protein SDC9_101450 [bioreactor metagenome]|uniref:Uncharacterized protein n=1 Tax=bioreactor metagenome TaxID=1076179 RepID=A0A645AQS3_9ZZZZ
MGVVHDAAAGETGHGLDASQIQQSGFHRPHLRAICIENEQEIVVLLDDLGLKPGQHTGAHRVSAHVHNSPNIAVFQNGQKLRRQGGHIRVAARLGGRNYPDAGIFQQLPPFPRTEIWIHNIHVRQHGGMACVSQRQRIVYSKLGLSGAIVSAHKDDAVGTDLIGS